jgi:hypothetical protein
MTYEIDTAIPLAPKRTVRHKTLYPFRQMKIGDSFAVDGLREFRRVQQAASIYGQRLGCKFASRVNEDNDGGRIWRVA